MNRHSDIDRVLQVWMADGPAAIPDRVVDVVASRIGVQRQRRTWPFPGRTTVNTQIKLIAGLAAAVVLVVVGWQFLPSNGPGTAVPTPTPRTTPTPAPSVASIQDIPVTGGALDAGRWRFRPDAGSGTLSIVAELPDGWLAWEGGRGIEQVVATNSPPSGLAIDFEAPANGVFSDPCHWNVDGSGKGDQPGDVAVGPGVADLVDALRANTSYTSSAPTSVAFGSYSGQRLELTLPADLDPSTCDRDPAEDAGTYRLMPDTIYSQGPANVWTMFIVDVAGTRIVAIIEHFPGTDPAKLAEANAIVESFVFTP